MDAEAAGRRGDRALYLRLVLLAAAIGIPAALVAALFLAFVHRLEDVLWIDLPDRLGASSPPWYLVLGLPVVGAGIVLAARWLLPGDGGHPPLGGLSAAPTPVRYAPGVALAAIGTLSFGAVLGPEAPLIALGSVVGMVFTPLIKPDPRGQTVLATAGSFSAISALFGGPLVAGMLMVETGIGMGPMLILALLPGLVSAAIGYLIFVGLGDWGGLQATVLTVPDLPPYHGTHLLDLLVGIAVGLAAAVVLEGVRRLGTWVDHLHEHRWGMPGLLLAGGLAVGGLALLARAFGADSQDVLFSGQSSVPVEVHTPSLEIVIVLLVAKTIAYAISLGCGFRGGPVFPAIFAGVGLAAIAEDVFGVSPTLTVAVGAAAGMAAMTKLIFAPLLFSALLVGSDALDTVPAAVLAAAAAWLATAALERRFGAADADRGAARQGP
jgi:H+/Cl- antiporter ClcA